MVTVPRRAPIPVPPARELPLLLPPSPPELLPETSGGTELPVCELVCRWLPWLPSVHWPRPPSWVPAEQLVQHGLQVLRLGVAQAVDEDGLLRGGIGIQLLYDAGDRFQHFGGGGDDERVGALIGGGADPPEFSDGIDRAWGLGGSRRTAGALQDRRLEDGFQQLAGQIRIGIFQGKDLDLGPVQRAGIQQLYDPFDYLERIGRRRDDHRVGSIIRRRRDLRLDRNFLAVGLGAGNLSRLVGLKDGAEQLGHGSGVGVLHRE